MPKIGKIFAQLVFLAIFRNTTTFDSKPEILSKSQRVKFHPLLAPKLLIIHIFTDTQLPYLPSMQSNQKITEK